MYQITIIIILLILILWHMLECPFVSFNEFALAATRSGYFENLQMQDLIYRGCATSDQYLEKYLGSFVQFTLEEKFYLHHMINTARQILPYKLQNIQWKFAKLRSDVTVEFSYPHTMSDVIVLNDRTIHVKSSDDLLKTLIHELVHIRQKLYPEEADLLLSELGFYRIPATVDLSLYSNELMPAAAANPDAVGEYYINHGSYRWLLRTAYNDHLDGRNVKNVMINMTDMTVQPVNFQEDLAYQGQPREIVAELAARIITESDYVDDKYYIPIVRWLNL